MGTISGERPGPLFDLKGLYPDMLLSRSSSSFWSRNCLPDKPIGPPPSNKPSFLLGLTNEFSKGATGILLDGE